MRTSILRLDRSYGWEINPYFYWHEFCIFKNRDFIYLIQFEEANEPRPLMRCRWAEGGEWGGLMMDWWWAEGELGGLWEGWWWVEGGLGWLRVGWVDWEFAEGRLIGLRVGLGWTESWLGTGLGCLKMKFFLLTCAKSDIIWSVRSSLVHTPTKLAAYRPAYAFIRHGLPMMSWH